ncbi:MAG: hypothetical protein JWO86_656 [Myxococcaceae bacterium]|nr:hypothetical protein [Myxococcaceae bacterium]
MIPYVLAAGACATAYGSDDTAASDVNDGGRDAATNGDTSSPPNDAATSDAGADGATTARRRIFATAGLFRGGEFGGLAGADKLCAQAAKRQSLPGRYVAWLSDSTTSAITRIVSNGPWYRVDDTIAVFETRAQLAQGPVASVLLDENGIPIDGGANVWTGTFADGGRASANCSNWTVISPGNGKAGLASSNDAFWTDAFDEPCSDYVRLLCLQAD